MALAAPASAAVKLASARSKPARVAAPHDSVAAARPVPAGSKVCRVARLVAAAAPRAAAPRGTRRAPRFRRRVAARALPPASQQCLPLQRPLVASCLVATAAGSAGDLAPASDQQASAQPVRTLLRRSGCAHSAAFGALIASRVSAARLQAAPRSVWAPLVEAVAKLLPPTVFAGFAIDLMKSNLAAGHASARSSADVLVTAALAGAGWAFGKYLEAVNKRFDAVDKRFDAVDMALRELKSTRSP